MKNIILIAAPAAGKGTLSDLLVKKYGYIHISTGDLLREVSKQETELGKKIANMLKNGELVTDEIVFELLENKLAMTDKPYILDGFPRTINQAHKYDELIKKLNKELGIVVVLNCDEDTLRKRIVGRHLCKDCGSIYNTLTGVNTPKEKGVCDTCGGELYKRSDDNEESFKNRYDTYLEKTKPLIDFYQEKGNLYYIDSSATDSMLKEIEDLL